MPQACVIVCALCIYATCGCKYSCIHVLCGGGMNIFLNCVNSRAHFGGSARIRNRGS